MPETAANGLTLSGYVDATDLANSPTVSLGGKAFHIPKLAPKQNRVVVGALKKLLPIITRLDGFAALAKVDMAAAGAKLLADFPFDEPAMEQAELVVYTALTRGYVLSRDQFDNMPIAADELLMALPAIIQQSFAFTKKEAAPGALAGEAQKAMAEGSASLTMPPGTTSSSASVEPSDGPGIT